MKVVIFGLGYVGTVSAACLADIGHEVIGTDINSVKVEMINQGKSPIVENQIDELVMKGVQTGKLCATTGDAADFDGADAAIICVGTPNQEDGSHSLDSVKRTCERIGQNIHRMADYPIIVMRSTVIPGTTEKLVIPIIEAESGKREGDDFGICFNPEFLREGTSIFDFYNPPFTVLGCRLKKTYERIHPLYKVIDAPVYQTEIRVAEMVKMISNTYHAAKITFANEVAKICKEYGIDSYQVMDLFCQDTKLNISSAYLKPGFAFGGSCLPKDIKALMYMGRQKNLDLPFIESIMRSNEGQIKAGFDLIAKTNKKQVGFLGFSFKDGTDDLRYSAQVELIERLIGKGYNVRLYDRNVSLAKIYGANKEFIEKEIPHISSLMCKSMEEVINHSEVIVIGNKDQSFTKVFELLKPGQIIVDLVRIINERPNLNGQYRGIGW